MVISVPVLTGALMFAGMLMRRAIVFQLRPYHRHPATGTEPGAYLVVSPGFWNGGTPAAIKQVFSFIPRSSRLSSSARSFWRKYDMADGSSGRRLPGAARFCPRICTSPAAPRPRRAPPQLPPGELGHGETNFFPVISTFATAIRTGRDQKKGTHPAPDSSPASAIGAGKKV